ncbi:MAG: tRNA preQ1(34) S-adenosylmethionine ribosyltransferase-isomerase QueA [Lentisphaerae bacterium]|nr:tRNA preQ1(34) S-adenosylmethionine ribosyltransferase-isomerase QueA [Lentisphaerota bacterium]
MQTSDFDFELPAELIAQVPAAERTLARMLVLHRDTGRLEHCGITQLGEYLSPGDLLVLNDTRVIPARLLGTRRDTGGRCEVLLLEPAVPAGPAATATSPPAETAGSIGPEHWHALYRAAGRAAVGQHLELADGHVRATLVQLLGDGRVTVRLEADAPLSAVLEAHGIVPVPPYIRRKADAGARRELDRERYQTVYARSPGAVAAPTAGLHFTDELLDGLRRKGVGVATITLHVGPGTFKPVKVESVDDHVMDPERYTVSPESAAAIRQVRQAGGRLVAVGSTTVRTLETVVQAHGDVVAGSGRSALFIHPPFSFRVVDRMLTNFHLPRSTLLMMVSAFAGARGGDPDAGRQMALKAYAAAIQARYRFYSYGDCMLML